MIEGEIRKAANLVSQFHFKNSNKLLEDAGKCTKEYMESITMKRLDQ